jgi:hypothetical protein
LAPNSIYHTFVEDDLPWSVKLKSQENIRQHIESMEWKHYRADELVNFFCEAELEVISLLVGVTSYNWLFQ